MNKAYERINWENYPSENTALNEENLNKMDSALNEVDNRVVSHETTKLDKATANSMVKDVSFDETTGIFTITFLNGVTKTLDTKLEKIATNFRYDYATQKLILTLVDGTTQEIDMSTLITQYEFADSSYIKWTIMSDGKIKAEIIDGSITADKLQPNFLADVTLQANSAKTSEQNAKTSEENAKQSEINAKNYADSAEPVASTANGLNPTLENSTHAPIIAFKGKGATIQDGEPMPDNPVDIVGVGESGVLEAKSTGANIFGGLPFAQALNSASATSEIDTTNKTVTFDHFKTESIVLFDDFKENTQYTFMCNGKTKYENGKNTSLQIVYTDKTVDYPYFTTTSDTIIVVTRAGKTVSHLELNYGHGAITTLNYEKCGIFEGVITETDFQPYTETTANIPLSEPLYEGDYIRLNMDGSGELVRKMTSVVFDGSESWSNWTSTGLNQFYTIKSNALHKKDKVRVHSSHFIGITIDKRENNYETIYTGLQSNVSYINVNTQVATTVDEWKAWLAENPVTVIYELAEPTVTPLTAEQIAEFEKLQTFDGTTHITCEAECEVQYFCDSVSGKAVAMVASKANTSAELPIGSVIMIEEQNTEKPKYGEWSYLFTQIIDGESGGTPRAVSVNVYKRRA